MRKPSWNVRTDGTGHYRAYYEHHGRKHRLRGGTFRADFPIPSSAVLKSIARSTELTGYLAGFSGQGVVENRKWYDRISGWMKKYGGIIILVLAIIPNPLFDIAGMVAGTLRMPLWKYLLWSWPGKCFKMLLFALGGVGILNLF
mgnify:CR=1 FL=1